MVDDLHLTTNFATFLRILLNFLTFLKPSLKQSSKLWLAQTEYAHSGGSSISINSLSSPIVPLSDPSLFVFKKNLYNTDHKNPSKV